MAKRTVAIYGGSFNPPHRGHFETLRIVQNEIRPDALWMMFSKNRLKYDADYAPIKNRMEMANILGKEFHDLSVHYSDYEDKIGKSATYDVLCSLRNDYHDTGFIWVMGADNLAEFHKWNNWENIIGEFPILVINRTGFRDTALSGPAAVKYAALKTESRLLRESQSGWAFCESAPTDESSSRIRKDLSDGKRQFNSDSDLIIPYITGNRLYGT